jgi:hypothetical protein
MKSERDNMPTVDFTRATNATGEVATAIDECFTFKLWDAVMVEKGTAVCKALAEAVKVIIDNVPPGPDRTVAIRKIREARMDCNSSITFGGRY